MSSNGRVNGAGASDLPDVLAGVIKEHGQGMVALVYGVGMAAEAAQVLARVQTPEALQALQVLTAVFNQTSSQLCRIMGWTEEMLALCSRDIELAFASCVQVAGPKIVLAS
jgi:hypothetical protein